MASGEAAFGIPKPITFTPSPQVLLNADTGQIIGTNAFSVTPSGTDGYFAVLLPATNDPDIVPLNWTYAVAEPTGRKYNIYVDINTAPLNAPGDPLDGQQVIDLVTIIPAPGASSGTVQLVGGAVANLIDVVLPDPIPGGAVLVYDSERGIWQAQILDFEDEETPSSGGFPVGPTSSRPSPTVVGRVYYDTTLNLPIIGDGSNWRKFDGTVLSGGGGGTSVPAPQNFRATIDQTARTINCEWDAVTGADYYKLYEDRSPTGVTGATNLTTTSSVRGPLTGNGTTYNYWVTAFKNGVESPISNKAGGVLGSSGGGGGGTTGTAGKILNIANSSGKNHFNVGIGYSAAHKDMTPAEIASGFEDNPYFYGNGTKAHFQVFMNGAKTSTNTKYPRSELRELKENGVDKADWNGGSGTHWMEGKSTITHLPPNKSSVCFTQIHDAKSDLCRVQTEGSASGGVKIVVRNTPPGSTTETVKTIMSSYTVGTELTWRFEVVDGTGKFFLNGSLAQTFPANTTGCYFKTGAYSQSNSTLDAASEYVAVELRDLKHWHTGWPTPENPGTSAAGFGTAPYGTSKFGG